MIKLSARGMAIGIFVPITILFNSYLPSDIKINYFIPVENYYSLIIYLILFFPFVGTPNTSLPMTNSELISLCLAIIANGFLYAIAFVFVKKILLLLRKLKEGEI